MTDGDDLRGVRRSHGRLQQDTLACDMGPVSDLSAGGMRLICRRVPKGEFTVTLYDAGERVEVTAQVAWSRRIGFFKHEVGVQFINVDAEMARRLTTAATNNRVRRAI